MRFQDALEGSQNTGVIVQDNYPLASRHSRTSQQDGILPLTRYSPKGLDGERARMGAGLHRFPALRRRADRHHVIVAALEAAALQHLVEHEASAFASSHRLSGTSLRAVRCPR